MTTLHNAGLYLTHARELYGEAEFALTLSHVQSWLASETVQGECRKFANGTRDGGLKPFVIKYVEPQAGVRHYAKDDPLLTLAGARVKAIAESAIGPARLLCLDLWHNPPACNQHVPKWSQAWHRDPEDSQLVKVFVYFSEVDEASGPFEYVWCSHLNWWDVCPPQPRGYNEKPIDVSGIPRELFAKVTGKIGTVAFCQTSGLHKGGHGAKARTMAVLTYVPEESAAKTLIRVL